MNSFQLDKYTQLIKSFLKNKISAIDFERKYLDSYLSDETDLPDDIFWILDELFADVDAFCADATLRDEYDLDDAQLRNRCEQTLNRLQMLEARR
jgi:hypothetical protein